MKVKLMSALMIGACAMMVLAKAKNNDILDFNGGFEKCQANTKGVVMPTYWRVNKYVGKNASVVATMEKEEVRNGKFALKVETEEKGFVQFFNSHASIKVKAGEKIRISLCSKGDGTFKFGFYCNGLKNGKQAFITTIMSKDCKPDEDKWRQFTYVFKVRPLSRAKAMPNSLRVAIFVSSANSELLFDDLKVEKIDNAVKAGDKK